jgi:hypothetical protein
LMNKLTCSQHGQRSRELGLGALQSLQGTLQARYLALSFGSYSFGNLSPPECNVELTSLALPLVDLGLDCSVELGGHNLDRFGPGSFPWSLDRFGVRGHRVYGATTNGHLVKVGLRDQPGPFGNLVRGCLGGRAPEGIGKLPCLHSPHDGLGAYLAILGSLDDA